MNEEKKNNIECFLEHIKCFINVEPVQCETHNKKKLIELVWRALWPNFSTTCTEGGLKIENQTGCASFNCYSILHVCVCCFFFYAIELSMHTTKKIYSLLCSNNNSSLFWISSTFILY